MVVVGSSKKIFSKQKSAWPSINVSLLTQRLEIYSKRYCIVTFFTASVYYSR